MLGARANHQKMIYPTCAAFPTIRQMLLLELVMRRSIKATIFSPHHVRLSIFCSRVTQGVALG
ncbi:MAG: hypothetical protein GY928_07655 [Colwellia sp.]|nr:hypothetical protein [Colwellia sp.]